MDVMNHTTEPGWFYAYGYNWKQMGQPKCADLTPREETELHFKNLSNRQRAKGKHGLVCECFDCLAGIRLVNKGWRPDKS